MILHCMTAVRPEATSPNNCLLLQCLERARLPRSKQAAAYALAMRSRLPAYRLSYVPPVEQASWIATAVRRAWGVREGAAVDVASQLAKLGWTVRVQDLDAPTGGLQAAMAPSSDGFIFISDPRPGPDTFGRLPSSRDALNFRLAHELGHVFFYDQGTPPRRLTRESDEEELFCDAFAAALLLIGWSRATGPTTEPLSSLA